MPRRRAHSACEWCRLRKVRCDATTFGCPCTRCIQDGRTDCSLRKHDLPILRASPRKASSPRSPSINGQQIQRNHPQGHVPFSSYSFLDLSIFANLDQGDLAFLASKGCLSLPNRKFIGEFITQYFLQVHTWAPMVDEAKFWDLYQSDEDISDGSKFSLLVFQALLFISSPYVSLETLQECGFSDKRTAWNTLYNRSKLLFDFKGEQRPFAQAQAAFLLASYTSAEEPQAASLWLTRSIQITMALDPQDLESSLKKRLWWSIVLRDRSLCLGLRRRPQITSIGLGTDVEFFNEGDFADEIQRSQVYDPKTKRMLITVLQEQCRLAVLLTEMTTLIFTSHGLARPSLTLSEFRDTSTRIFRIRSSLQRWKSSFSLLDVKSVPSAVTRLINMTLMYYYTADMDLTHYQAILVENHLLFVGDDYYSQVCSAGNMLHESMNCLTDIMEYFGQAGRAQNFPLSLLAYVELPLVLTAINLKLSTSIPEMGDRRQRLERLGDVVQQSARVYDVTDFISACTNQILQLAYITYRHLYPRWDTRLASTTNMFSTPAGILPRAKSTSPANSWRDAYVQNPRAYLLISISLDYYLSVGRLPIDNVLPEFVRRIPYFGDEIRLPWVINTVEDIGGKKDKQQDNRTLSQGKASTYLTISDRVFPEDSPENTAVWMPYQDINQDHGHENDLMNHNQLNGGQVNLDYMSLDDVTVIPSNELLSQPDSFGEFDPPARCSATPAIENSISPICQPESCQLSMPHDVFICSLLQDCFSTIPEI